MLDRATPRKLMCCLCTDMPGALVRFVFCKFDSKVCGTGYQLPNGEVVESKGTLLSGLFSKTQATRLPVFATLVQGGKVKMGVAPPPSSE